MGTVGVGRNGPRHKVLVHAAPYRRTPRQSAWSPPIITLLKMATQSASRFEGVVGIAGATPTNKGENNPRTASKMKSGWNWATENPTARLWWHNHAGRSMHPRLVQDLLRILDSLHLPLIGETATLASRGVWCSAIRSDICACRPLVAAQRRRVCSLAIYSSWVSCSNQDRRQSIPTMAWIASQPVVY